MTRTEIIGARKYLQAENKKWPRELVEMPRSMWPKQTERPDIVRTAVYRSRTLLVQVFTEPNGIIRLSINRTELDRIGGWKDGFSWDELQSIKNAVGFSHNDAVEVFPRAADVVNVANIRHLWIVPNLPFAWRKDDPA